MIPCTTATDLFLAAAKMEAEHKAKLDAEAKAHQEAAVAMEKMHQDKELAKAAEDQRKAKEMEV